MPHPKSISTDFTPFEFDCPTEVRALLIGLVTARGEDPLNARRDQIAPLGHQLRQFAAAIRHLRQRADRGRLPPALATFVSRFLPDAAPGHVPDSGPWTALLRETGSDLRVQTTSVKGLASASWALLRLPALRRFWEVDLRRAHLRRLVALSPDVWVMDATRLPPGAVIAGLGLPSWEAIPRLHGDGRAFEIVAGGEKTRLDDETDASAWERSASEALAAGGGTLREVHRADAWWWGEWEVRDQRVELARLRRATLEAGTWKVVGLDP